MMAKLQLEKLGYRVDIRTDSRQALEMFKRHHGDFDLVISDMTMPHMPGDMLAREMKKIAPEIPIIICTGFSSRISEQKAAELGIRALVMKPLTRSELGRLVRKVLDSAEHQL
jgi:two-component system, cell cycle sensor histidine kinase and response regulator CckA